MTIFFPYCWFLVHFWLLPKNWQKIHIFNTYHHTNISTSTYHIPTYQHTTYQHITYPHSHISHVFAPNFVCVNIPLSCPKTIPLLEFKNILWNWTLQINGILMNSAFGLYQLVSSCTLPLFSSLFFCFFFKDYLASIVD
jgi:hypothetical protein